MTRGRLGLLTVTHLAAIGLGVGAGYVPYRKDSLADQGPTGKTDRDSKTARRVSERDLLAAYQDSSVWGEVAGLRREKDRAKQQARLKGASSGEEEEKWVPPEERAAKVTHLRAAMDERAELVRRGKGYDAEFSRALIRRWMAEDPEACMAWLGQMNLPGSGWQDPFSALFEGEMAIEPLRAVEIMGTNWLPKYKRSGMKALAERLGRDGVDELAPVLEQLEGATRSRFLRDAMSSGHSGNLDRWLELVEAFGSGESEKLFVQLAEGVMPGWSSRPWERGKDLEKREQWKEQNVAILEVAAGTPAEEIFEKQWQKLFRSSEVDRFRGMALRDPGAALEGMADLRMAGGEDAATARRKAAEGLGQLLEKWDVSRWEDQLQRVVLGSTEMREALSDRFVSIDSLPVEFRETTGRRALTEALVIEPGATIAFAVEHGMEEVLGRAVGDGQLAYRRGKSKTAEMLVELMGGPIWEAVPQHDELLGDFAREYLMEDREGALAWLRSIPSRDQRQALVSLAQDKCRKMSRDDLAEQLTREFSERK